MDNQMNIGDMIVWLLSNFGVFIFVAAGIIGSLLKKRREGQPVDTGMPPIQSDSTMEPVQPKNASMKPRALTSESRSRTIQMEEGESIEWGRSEEALRIQSVLPRVDRASTASEPASEEDSDLLYNQNAAIAPRNTMQLNRAAQGVVWAEILGPPRSKKRL